MEENNVDDYYRKSFQDFVYPMRSRHRNFLDAKIIPFPSDYDEVSDSVQISDSESDEPHKYRPITLPLKDAIRYVRKYGPQAQTLQRLDEEVRNRRLSYARKMFLKAKEEMHCHARPDDKECTRYVNGCGSGFTEDVPLIFRSVFTPCCNKHDVCYDCGKTDSWTKDQCDETFLKDMENMCLCTYPSRYQALIYDACIVWAKTLYEVVHLFGGPYFTKVEKDFCKDKCILPYGSPNMTLLV